MTHQEQIALARAVLETASKEPLIASKVGAKLGIRADFVRKLRGRLEQAGMLVRESTHGFKPTVSCDVEEASLRRAIFTLKRNPMGGKLECHSCGDVKEYIPSGIGPNGRMTYLDETGKKWLRRKCFECQVKAAKQKHVRKCRKCGGDLPASCYFKHEDCRQPIEFDEAFLYCT